MCRILKSEKNHPSIPFSSFAKAIKMSNKLKKKNQVKVFFQYFNNTTLVVST